MIKLLDAIILDKVAVCKCAAHTRKADYIVLDYSQ